MSKWLKWAAENLGPATMERDSEFGGDFVVYLDGSYRPCAQIRVLPDDLYEFCYYDSLSTTGWRIQIPRGNFEDTSKALLTEVNEMANRR